MFREIKLYNKELDKNEAIKLGNAVYAILFSTLMGVLILSKNFLEGVPEVKGSLDIWIYAIAYFPYFLIINYFFIDWIDLNKAPHFDPKVTVLDVLLWLTSGIFQVFIGVWIYYGNFMEAGLLTGGYHVLVSCFRNKRLSHDLRDIKNKSQQQTAGSLKKSINYTWATRIFSVFVLVFFIGLKIFCLEIDQNGHSIWFIGSKEIDELTIWKCFSYTLILFWFIFTLLKIERSHNYIFVRYAKSMEEMEIKIKNLKKLEMKQLYEYMYRRFSNHLKKKGNNQDKSKDL